MNGATVSLIINLVLILVLIIGFFIGVVRGAKKQGVRSLYFIGFLIVFLLIAPLISNALMGVQINGQSLSGYIENAIVSNESVNNMMTSNPELLELAHKLPIVVINLGVVFVLTLLALLFSGIAYIITKHIHLNKYKREAKRRKKEMATTENGNNKIYTVKDGQPVVIDKPEPKSKRYRWWGGLIGAVSGFVIMFAILLPITGLARTAMTYIDFSVKAEEVVQEQKSDEFVYQELSDKLKELLGPDIVDILKGVNDSVFIKVSSVGNLDLALFDTISSVKVNGEKVVLRQEVKAVADVAEGVLYVMDAIPTNQNGSYDFASMDWQIVDFDKLEKAINSLFSSGILRSVGEDLINNVFTDEFVDENITKDLFGDITDEQFIDYKNYVKEVFKEIKIAYTKDNGKSLIQLKKDLLSMLGIAKAVVNSGLANYLSDIDGYHSALATPQTNFDVVVECLYGKNSGSLKANHDYLKDITDSIFESSTIEGLLVAGVNIGVDVLKTEINNMIKNQSTTPTEVKFSTLDQEKVNWNKVSSSFKEMLDNGIKVYQYYQDEVMPILDDNQLEQTQKIANIAGSLGFENCLTNIGKILNNLTNSPLFKFTDANNNEISLIDEVLNEFNKVDDINKYVNLNEFKNFNWENELKIIPDLASFVASALDEYKNIDYTTLEYTKLQSVMNKVFDSTITKAIKTTWIKEAVDYDNMDAKTKEVYDVVFDENVTKMSDLKNVFMPMLNILIDVAKAGTIDLALCEFDSITDFSEPVIALCTNLIKDDSYLLRDMLDNLSANDKLKKLFVTVFNNVVVPYCENDGRVVGTISLPQNEDVWTEAKTKSANFLTLFAKTLQTAKLDKTTLEEIVIQIFDALVTTSGDKTLMEKTGVAFDEWMDCELFKNQNNESVIKNIVYIMTSSGWEYVYDKSDNFWETEATLWADAIKILNSTVVGEENTTLMYLIIKQNNTDLLMSSLKQLQEEDINTITKALCNTKFLSVKAKETLDKLNKTLINAIDTTYNQKVVGEDANLPLQEESIAKVLYTGLKIKDLDLDDTEIVEQNKDSIKAFINALEDNATLTPAGIFKDAYDKFSEKFSTLIEE